AVASQTRTGIVATVDLYTQLARATEGQGIAQSKLVEITKTINNTMLASGGSADSMRAAITQLGQGLAAGVLRGEEFNSVSEQAPLLLKAIREETGKTVGELRKFAQDGGITTELIIKSLDGYSAAAQEAADAMGRTFGQSLVLARNNAIEFVGASAEITQAVGVAGGAVVAVSQNLDILVGLIGAVATVITARSLSALGTWT
ncbi:MAG: tape measure protein, partial [Rhodanobacter sp.]